MQARKWQGPGSWTAALTVLSSLALAASAAAAGPPGAPTGPVTFSKDVAPILQAKCQECHQPNSIAPMSLITYQGSAAVGAIDQAARGGAPDAAVAHRPERRRPEVQERHVADRRADRHDRPLGGCRRACKAIRRTLPPPKPLVTDNEWQGVRDGFGPPDLVIKSPEYTMPAQAPGRLVPADERHPPHRAALDEDGGDSPDEPEGAQDRASLDRLSRAEPTIARRSTPARRTAATRPSTREDLVNRRPQIMEWAIGKGYDLFRQGTGKLILPGEKISWDQHLHAVGEEIDGRIGDRDLVLSERPGAEEAQLSDRVHRTQTARASSTFRRTRSRTPKASRC